MFSLQRETAGLVTDRHPRRSFTLIELLMVIVIISILMSLAFAGFSAVMTQARVAEVKVEIDGMASALAQFKAKFGFYPPSRMRLYATQAGWNSDSRSRAVIRQMFPQFDFKGTASVRPGGAPWTSMKTLTGAECLVFFLGGVQNPDGVPIGFSSNSSRPFLGGKSNRIGPFFDFDPGRVKDTDVDGDNMREYVSTLSSQTTPYLYLSAYKGRGYATRQVNLVYNDLDVFKKGNSKNIDSSYIQGTQTGAPKWNPKSFQIICPGFDDEYGVGGGFDPNNGKATLKLKDQDNITNFHTGMLAP